MAVRLTVSIIRHLTYKFSHDYGILKYQFLGILNHVTPT